MKKITKNKVFQRLSTCKAIMLFLVFTFMGIQSAKAQYTSIPDVNFEKALFDLGIDTVNGDHQVLTSAISGVTILDVSSKSISSLEGIQGFTNLQELNCSFNQLTSLNLSGFTTLTSLNCKHNQLTSLNLSGLSIIDILDCSYNSINSLNVDANTVLTYLDCGNNLLSSLNVDANTALTYLNCGTNSISSLNVSANTALTGLACNNNSLSSLNVSANTALTGLTCSYNSLSSLNVDANTALTSLTCRKNSFTSLNVSGLTNLQNLDCAYNNLTSLNVSGLTYLGVLYCNKNQITTLNMNGLTSLYLLSCRDNLLQSIDFSGLNLNTLYCQNNLLTSLNLSSLTNLSTLFCNNNPSLSCITVSDPIDAAANFSYIKDETAHYSTDCNTSQTFQIFCTTATIADLVATGSGIQWYASATGGTALASNFVLTNGTYYISQTVDGIESARNTSVYVKITDPYITPEFTVIDPIAPGTALSALPTTSLNGITGTWSPSLNTTHNTTYTFTPDAKQCATTTTLDITVQIMICNTGTIANLTPNGSAIKWYLAATGGTKLASTILLTTKMYYYTQTIGGVEGPRNEISVVVNKPTAPIASNQVFCLSGSVSDLVATGSGILWYSTAKGGLAIDPSTPIVSGNYYASQTINGCESIARKAITVKLNVTATPTASSTQTFCYGAKVSNLVASGTLLKWYTTATGGTALAATTLLNSGTYYVSQTLTACESLRTAVTVVVTTTPAPTASSQTFNPGSKVADLVATGTSVKWYSASTGGTALATTTVLSSTTYYVSQTVNGCESARTPVSVVIIGTPTPNASAQTLCNGATIANLSAVGSNIKWYATVTGGTAIASTYILVTKTYYVSQTINGIESARTTVPVTIITTPAPWAAFQSFTFAATVSNLVATGTDIKWYATSTGGTSLNASTPLVSGALYYCSQTLNGCESARRAIGVRISVALIGNSNNTSIAKTEIPSTEFTIYPNPVSNILSIETSSDTTIDKVVVIDLYGKVLLEETPINNQIKVEQFAAGTYMIQISSGEEKFLTKFIKN